MNCIINNLTKTYVHRPSKIVSNLEFIKSAIDFPFLKSANFLKENFRFNKQNLLLFAASEHNLQGFCSFITQFPKDFYR